MRYALIASVLAALGGCASATTTSSNSPDSDKLVTIEHYVRVRSAVPSMTGQSALLYVRERSEARNILRGTVPIVLFVHGAGTPAEVAFDVPASDYSWMSFLAHAGFDVFSVDMTGYGRSTRPTVMNDPCNLSSDQQAAFMPTVIPARCPPTYPHPATTIASDWNDLGAVVEYLRALRHADRVNMVGWSLGGPRAGGYAAQHPEQIQRLVLLAPAYNRTAPDGPPSATSPAAAMNTQSQREFTANWDRQVGCADQYDSVVRDAVWSTMLESDPVGATWGPGVRRAPQTQTWGWNLAMVSKTETPALLVAGEHDKQVAPARVNELYADLGSPEKLLIDLGCSSHNAMWEKNHLILFKASAEWLSSGTVNGAKQGTMKLGYGN
jgi:pimeloyl-ACP methyl ester carboxylesterase